jgi:SAM-dependent methyltransferase
LGQCFRARYRKGPLLSRASKDPTHVSGYDTIRDLAAHRTQLQLLDQDLSASLPKGPFDLVVSFFAIHHVENEQRLVHDVFASLASGGMFIHADITITPDPGLERSFLSGWVAFMRGAGLDPKRSPHVLTDHREHDIGESSSTQLWYLRAAGFAPAQVIWSWQKFALVYATNRPRVTDAGLTAAPNWRHGR